MSVPNAIEQVLIDVLKNDATVSGFVGGNIHIYEESTSGLPYITIARRSSNKEFGVKDTYRQFLIDTTRYNIKSVVRKQDGGFSKGDQILAAINSALLGHEQWKTAIDGKEYYVDIPEMEDDIRYAQDDRGVIYCHVGGVFIVIVTPDDDIEG